MVIEKKIWPEYFEAVEKGEKTFELRLADFACEPGDKLQLREWDPTSQKYTGRSIEKIVTYVTKTKDVKFWTTDEIEKYGYQIVAFK